MEVNVMVSTRRNILEKAKILFEDARNIELIEQNVACITTQYLDNHNDYVQIYFIAEEQEYTFTDDGWILEDIKHLPTYDENLKSIERILKRFGIDRNEDEISVKTDLANLTNSPYAAGIIKHCNLSINYYF